MDEDQTSVNPGNERKTDTGDNDNNDTDNNDVPSRPRSNSKISAEEARNQALQRELENVRNVNKVIEDATASLQKAKNNMEVNNCSILLRSCSGPSFPLVDRPLLG